MTNVWKMIILEYFHIKCQNLKKILMFFIFYIKNLTSKIIADSQNPIYENQNKKKMNYFCIFLYQKGQL